MLWITNLPSYTNCGEPHSNLVSRSPKPITQGAQAKSLPIKNSNAMKKKGETKCQYTAPRSWVIATDFENLMNETSFNNKNGHKEAGDDNQDLDVKQGLFDEEPDIFVNDGYH